MPVPISNVTRRVVFAASGTGPYAFTFEILAASDIAVYEDDTLLTLTTDYTVTINANGTGSVTLVVSPTGTQIAIVGNRTIARATDFTTGGDFFANTLNDELDQQTIFAQQNAEGLQRALQAPQTDPTSINMVLPRSTVRANKVLSFDATGNPTATEFIGENRGNWAAGTSYNKRDIVKDTSNGNIYYANTAHTSSGAQPIDTNADVAKWTLLVDAASATTSAAAAASSASAASTSASNASTSASNASTSATNASNSASSASTSATNASNSATAAAGSASAASASASAASTSETNAAASESAAATSASNASSSASAASTSASNASTSATNAANSASAAGTSETNAASSASSASTSASNAATSATNAANSATASSNSATNAANSATAAAGSATSAANSAAAAAASFDSFDDRYLGVKASDPTVDNDGDPLTAGLLYFSSSENIMKVYDGASWIAATSAGNVSFLRYKYTATGGQTTFTGADDNAATLSYTINNIVVFLNGVALDAADYTATNGTSIVLASAAAASDELVVVAFKSFVTADMVPASTGGTFAGNVTVQGTLNATALNTSGAVVFNDAGADVDFRVEGDTEANLLFVDASTDRVGIGTSTPASKLHIQANANAISVDDGLSVRNSNSGSSAGARIALGNDVGTAPGLQLASSTNTTFGANALTVYQNLSAPVTFWTNNTERMRIDSSGNLSLGTTTAVTKATVYGSGDQKLSLVSPTGSSTQVGINLSPSMTDAEAAANPAQAAIYATDSSYSANIIFANKATGAVGNALTERMRITSGGGVQTPTTSTETHEFGVDRTGLSFSVTNANTSSPFGAAIRFPGATPNNTTNYFLYCDDSTNSKAIIYSDGSFQSRANSYGGISDVKLKQDIVDANSQWDDIKGLRIRKYRFKDEVAADPNYPSHLGVIAQEAELVSPGLVFESPDFENVIRIREVEKTRVVTEAVLDEDGNEIEPAVTETYTEEEEYTERVATGTVTKGVKYSILYMKAVKALQEAMERIETLEAKVAALETGV
jgi:hypothetical protein